MSLLADAHVAADLFTDDLIAADKQLDVIGGSAGAILGLLRLYRDSQSADVLRRATKCGEHLMRQSRTRTGGPPELGRTRLRPASAERHVARCGRLCLCARFVVGGDRARGVRDKPRRNASHLKIPVTTQSVTTGPISAAAEQPSGHANGVTERPASVLRALPRPSGEEWMPRRWQSTSETPLRAPSKAGLASSIRSAVERSAASNSSARPAAPLSAAIFVNLHRGG